MSQETRDARIAAAEKSQTFAEKLKALEATKPMPDQFRTPEEHEEALGRWMENQGKTISLLRSKGYADPSSSAASEKKLPDAPTRDQFPSQDEFEESLGYWHSHVGRIKGLAARALKTSQAEQKQDTPNTTGGESQPVSHLSTPLPASDPFFTRGFIIGQTVGMTMPPKPKRSEK